MIYIIDHQDSFTWNVVHQFSKFDKVYCSNYFNINKKKLDQSNTIVLSPGPGSPKDYPLTSKIYKKYKGRKKIIGICLGYQQILFNEKGKIVQQKNIFHGYQSNVKVTTHDEVYDDQIDYEGTINGKPWRAEQTHEGDEGEASYYTSVFDANEEELQETDPDAYDDVIAAINDYMEEEGLDPASSFGDD